MQTFTTSGVCAKTIDFKIEEGIVKSVKFNGGCAGNAIGLSALVEGMKVEDVVTRLQGTECGKRPTSCPDQLSKALKEFIK
ncbi:TIGR03905 family TSCPD domain-containing protein [Psychrilyobacter atlanticus]|uniref:TIGR03905 family TSCPD domain-containing protein n=1 Tax=Psychrilyobacter atlanticus TaxID=271091 RepID=UPI0004170802|nr:TIGR03905 family TSCPD domain-containing protein [Psychrilyobacter atlanticus]